MRLHVGRLYLARERCDGYDGCGRSYFHLGLTPRYKGKPISKQWVGDVLRAQDFDLYVACALNRLSRMP